MNQRKAGSGIVICNRDNARRIALAIAPVLPFVFKPALAAAQQGPFGTVTFSTVSTNAYGAGDINSCSVDINNLTTIDGYQFMAFYNNSGHVVIGRRQASSSANNTNTWQLDTTTFTADSASGGVSDDHHTISIAIDGNGQMHVSWGMHNDAFNYAISGASVIPASGNPSFSPSFTTESQTQMATWFPELNTSNGGVDQITYPQFYNIPGSGNLLLVYRDAASASGGGSGNGNEYFAVYNAATKSYSSAQNVEMLDGGITSVNGYMNNLAYNASGNLIATWTWRATPNWQTNSDVLFASSTTNGASWNQFNGTPYGLPIIQNTSDGGNANQVAQSVFNIPQGDSYINQTCEAIDTNGHPMVATYLAPGWTATSATAGSGNPNRQYVLIYYNGSSWQQSVIGDRTSDTAVDYSGNDVRDLGRPLVMVDKQGRVIVVTRSEDSSMGSADNPSTPNNDIVAYYATESSLDAGSPNWRPVTLDTANMGQYEPTYDPGLWQQSNILNLIYEPVGLTGEGQQTIKTLQWDEQTFFADGETWDNVSGSGDGATWDQANNANWNNGTNTITYMNGDNITFNDANNSRYTVTLNTTLQPGNITVNNSAGNYVIGGSGSIIGSGSLTKSGSATLTLNTTNFYTGGTTINAGTLIAGVNGALPVGAVTINGGELQLGASTGLTTLTSLSISANGTFDINNNHVIINYGSGSDPIASIAAWIKTGYAGGAWNGIGGIISSAAAVNPGYGVGYADWQDPGNPAHLASGTIEIKYTLLGDANLDGVVDGTDFGIVAANFNQGVTGWDEGDFNYDGVVDGTDFGDLAANFNKGTNGASLGEPAYEDPAILAFAAANGLLAYVPEPTTLVSLGLFSSALLARRSRRNSLSLKGSLHF